MGELTVADSTIANYTAFSLGGGIYSQGKATITDSVIAGNSAAGGGGIENEGAMTLSGTTIDGNVASGLSGNGNGAVGGGGGVLNAGTLKVVASTVSHNTAFFAGAGLDNSGSGTLATSDSTIVYNFATTSLADGGGLADMGGTIHAVNCTIAYNAVDPGGAAAACMSAGAAWSWTTR